MALKLLALTLAAAAAAAASASSNSSSSGFSQLPALSGPYRVGVTNLEVVDASREDPLAPEKHRPRDLMVSLYYPTVNFTSTSIAHGDNSYGHHYDNSSSYGHNYNSSNTYTHNYKNGSTHAHRHHDKDTCYLAPDFSPRIAAALESAAGIPANETGSILTRSCAGAPVTRPGERPVLFFSHGLGGARFLSTALLEELASRGWVVVAVDHTYDAVLVEFPDGRVVGGVSPEDPPEGSELDELVEVRAHDLVSVLDALGREEYLRQIPGLEKRGGRGKERHHHQHHDRLRTEGGVGVFGHSLGGATALRAMQLDGRFAAGANMDGAFRGPELEQLKQREDDDDDEEEEGEDKPFLLLAAENHDRANDASWAAFWEGFRGARKWHFQVAGALHLDFSDLALFKALPWVPAAYRGNLGDIEGRRALAVLGAYLGSFFDRAVRGRDDGLLDGVGAAAWPEVSVGR